MGGVGRGSITSNGSGRTGILMRYEYDRYVWETLNQNQYNYPLKST